MTKKGSFSSIFGEMTLSYQQIADQLIKDGFILTALELHTELTENGKELESLKNFFSNSKNFSNSEDVINSLQSPETPSKVGRRSSPGTPANNRVISRSGSQMTLDSIDQITRYSEDTDRKEEERCAILEYELRTAKETISQLKNEIAEISELNKHALDEDIDDSEDEIGPHEKKFLNYVVNDYLVRNGYKFTAVTFSDECDGQNLDDLEEIGVMCHKQPSLYNLYKTSAKKNQINNDELIEVEIQTVETELEEKEINKLDMENTQLRVLVQQHENDNFGLKKIVEELRNRFFDVENELKEKIEELECERNQHKNIIESHFLNQLEDEREEGDGASIIDDSTPIHLLEIHEKGVSIPNSIQEYVKEYETEISRLISSNFQETLIVNAFPISISKSPELAYYEKSILTYLSDILPNIVANLVLSSRSDIVPLIIFCINIHDDKKCRDNLLNLLFNLMKKPDKTLRKSIVTGLFWLVHQKDWTCDKIEEEILPHLLEQINLKYTEKKILVGEGLSVIAGKVERPIRSSLLTSLSLQLLEADCPDVVVTGIHTLSILMNMTNDEEKLHTVGNIVMKMAKNRSLEKEIHNAIDKTLMNVIYAWFLQEKTCLQILIKTVEELDFRSFEDASRKIDIIKKLIPFYHYNIVESLELENNTMENDIQTTPCEFHLLFGENFVSKVKQLTANNLDKSMSIESKQELISFIKLLFEAFSMVNIQDNLTIKELSDLLSFIIMIFGVHLTESFLLEIVLSHTKRLGPIFPISFSSFFIYDELRNKSMSLLIKWLTSTVDSYESINCLKPSILSICNDKKQRILMENFFELTKHKDLTVRQTTGQMIEFILSQDLSHDIPLVHQMIEPALLSLSSDLDESVRLSSIPGMVTLLSLPLVELGEKQMVTDQLNVMINEGTPDFIICVIKSVGDLLSTSASNCDRFLILFLYEIVSTIPGRKPNGYILKEALATLSIIFDLDNTGMLNQ